MKTLKIILILSFFVITPSVFAIGKNVANFSGHWVSTSGKVSSNIGLNSQCSKVEIIIEQTETHILTKLYNAECALFGTKWGPVSQEIRDGKVYENNEEVGTINQDTLITVSTSGSYKYAYNLKLFPAADGQVSLQSYYGTQGAAGAMATEAVHQKQ